MNKIIQSLKTLNPKDRWVIAGIVAFNALYILFGFIVFDSESWNAHAWRDGLWLFGHPACTLFLILAARNCEQARERIGWYWFAGAFLSYSLATVDWSWSRLVLNEPYPTDSLTYNLLTFSMDACILIGAFYFRAPQPRVAPRSWLLPIELAISLVLVLLLNSILIYQPLTEFSDRLNSFDASLAQAIAFPAATLMAAFVALLGPSFLPQSLRPTMRAAFAFSVGNSLSFYLVAFTRYYEASGGSDTTWTMALSLFFWAGYQRSQLPKKLAPSADRPVELSEAKPFNMTFFWLLILLCVIIGIAPLWSILHLPSRLLLISLCLLALLVSLRGELLLLKERKAREALSRSLQLREDFMTLAAHELRTPLTPLKGSLSIQRRLLQSNDRLDPDFAIRIQKLIRMCENQVERLQKLIEQILVAQRLERGDLALNREPIDLAELVRNVVNQHQEQLEQSQSEITITEEMPVRGAWDRTGIEYALTHLLTNAIKYGAGRPIEIRITQSAGHACISVRDQGIGIHPQDQSKIFMKFERATPVTGYGGIGLGLFIAQQIVKGHGGSIELESELGKGSVFTMKLPL